MDTECNLPVNHTSDRVRQWWMNQNKKGWVECKFGVEFEIMDGHLKPHCNSPSMVQIDRHQSTFAFRAKCAEFCLLSTIALNHGHISSIDGQICQRFGCKETYSTSTMNANEPMTADLPSCYSSPMPLDRPVTALSSWFLLPSDSIVTLEVSNRCP